MNRALRAAAIGVLLLAPVTLSACSAGQVNQTTAQSRDKAGATARVGNITMREVGLAYPQDGRYARGADAVLNAAIVNDGGASDTLVSISGDGFTGVDVTGTGAQASVPSGTASATGSSAATSTAATSTAAASTAATSTTATSTTGTGTATTTGATSTSGAATTTTAAAPTTTAALPSAATGTSVGIRIPGNSAVFLGQNAPHVTLTGLTQPLTAAQSLRVTFTFERAGTVTVDVPVASPANAVPNTSSFNFATTSSESPSGQGNG